MCLVGTFILSSGCTSLQKTPESVLKVVQNPAEEANDSEIIPNLSIGEYNTSYFTVQQIELMRDAAQNGSIPFDIALFGENVVISYPGSLDTVLDSFHHLKLRQGYIIEGCWIRDSFGGYVHPFILQSSTVVNYPEKIDEYCSKSQTGVALKTDDTIMVYVSGDDSPESYLEASLFLRELNAVGAWWHGLIGWPIQTVIDTPEKPKVIMNSTHAIVIFSTEESYCGQHTIIQYTDVFVRNNYKFNSQQKIIKREEEAAPCF